MGKAGSRRRNKYLIICAAAVILVGIVPIPGRAQGPGSCEDLLGQQISVNGLDPAALQFPVSTLTIPSLGFATEDMASAIDPIVGNYMNQNGAPGGVVAITYNNQLIFAKSYGYADLTNGLLTEPDSKMRIASVTKAMTAMGILKLVHDNEILVLPGSDWPLNYQPFSPPGFGSPVGGTRQTWIEPATVEDLLYHEGGWTEDYENYSHLMAVEGVLSSSGPPNCKTLLRYVEAQPMGSGDFLPGTGQAYSNIGFCALGETIRRLSGASSYIDYMQTNVFSPLGMNDTQLGSSQKSKQLDREVVYYPCGYLAGLTPPVVPIPCTNGTPPVEGPSFWAPHKTVSAAYGGGAYAYSLDSLEGAGGMVSTSIDLARFTGAIASGRLPNLAGGFPYPGWPENYYGYTAPSSRHMKSARASRTFGMEWVGTGCS